MYIFRFLYSLLVPAISIYRSLRWATLGLECPTQSTCDCHVLAQKVETTTKFILTYVALKTPIYCILPPSSHRP